VLTTLLALPVAGALISLVAGRRGSGATAMRVALAVSLVTFVLGLVLWARFDGTAAGYQFVERRAWLPDFGVSYHVGVDGISLFFVLLSTLLTPIAVLCSWRSIEERVGEFCAFLLLLETAMIGIFVSLDLFLFYVFWDAMLIPMYFLIGIWGHDRRHYASTKFLLYTMAASMVMLLAIVWLAYYHQSITGVPSFDLQDLIAIDIPGGTQTWLFLAFVLAFAVKAPLVPFHTWLPDALVQAPTGAAILLVGLKTGAYGLLRIGFPLFPMAVQELMPYVALLAAIGVAYGALIAIVQPDLKRLFAYASISHVGVIVLGICALTVQGLQGAVFQMVSQGISTVGLFLVAGMLWERRRTRLIAEFGGLKLVTPKLMGAFLLLSLASIGLPGTNGFVGEFLVLLGTFISPSLTNARVLAAVAATGVILSAVYMLWMFQRVSYGEVTDDRNRALRDLDLREWMVIAPMCAIAVLMGIVPGLFLAPMEPAVTRTLSETVAGAGPANAVRLPAPDAVVSTDPVLATPVVLPCSSERPC
jgi:NADH-quinone oxidoreductase subunit M